MTKPILIPTAPPGTRLKVTMTITARSTDELGAIDQADELRGTPIVMVGRAGSMDEPPPLAGVVDTIDVELLPAEGFEDDEPTTGVSP